jgi:hypothetical protein
LTASNKEIHRRIPNQSDLSKDGPPFENELHHEEEVREKPGDHLTDAEKQLAEHKFCVEHSPHPEQKEAACHIRLM